MSQSNHHIDDVLAVVADVFKGCKTFESLPAIAIGQAVPPGHSMTAAVLAYRQERGL